MPTKVDKAENAALAQIGAVDVFLQQVADSVPVPLWGFDQQVTTLIADRKHELMNEKLTGMRFT